MKVRIIANPIAGGGKGRIDQLGITYAVLLKKPHLPFAAAIPV